MKTKITTILLICGFLSVASIASPSLLRGQAPPGPLPPAKPVPQTQAPAQPNPQQPQQPQMKPNLSGSWKLNRDESDDPRKKMQEARGGNEGGDRGGAPGGGRRGGGGYPFPFPGSGGGGPYGGRGGSTGGRQPDEDRQRVPDLFKPADSLTIAQKDAEGDLTDDQNRKRIFYTDGRQLRSSKDDKYQEMAAQWQEGRLVSEENRPRGGKIRRSFELAPGGQQLYEIVRLDDSRSRSPVVIRYVYNILPENRQ